MNVAIPDSVISIGNGAFHGVGNIMYSGAATGAPWDAKSLNGNWEKAKEEERRKLVEKRKQEIEQTKKENKRIIIIIIIYKHRITILKFPPTKYLCKFSYSMNISK